MGRENVLLAGRAFLLASLVDTVTIQHPTGQTTNQTTGTVAYTYSTVYTGPGKIGGGVSPSGQDVAEAHLAVLSPVLDVPVEVVGVVQGDLVTVTASENDPELVGKFFRIQGPMRATFRTARRFSCTEVTS